MKMDENFIAQSFAELISAQEHALCVLCAVLAENGGREQLAEALEFQSAKIQHAAEHPKSELLLNKMLHFLRDE